MSASAIGYGHENSIRLGCSILWRFSKGRIANKIEKTIDIELRTSKEGKLLDAFYISAEDIKANVEMNGVNLAQPPDYVISRIVELIEDIYLDLIEDDRQRIMQTSYEH